MRETPEARTTAFTHFFCPLFSLAHLFRFCWGWVLIQCNLERLTSLPCCIQPSFELLLHPLLLVRYIPAFWNSPELSGEIEEGWNEGWREKSWVKWSHPFTVHSNLPELSGEIEEFSFCSDCSIPFLFPLTSSLPFFRSSRLGVRVQERPGAFGGWTWEGILDCLPFYHLPPHNFTNASG